jgi:hypothetical protein
MSCFLAIAAAWFGGDVIASPAASATPERQSLAWLSSSGASFGSVLNDPRFNTLLSNTVPRINIYLGMSRSKAAPPPLIEAVHEVLGGLDQSLTVRDGRYVMLSSCRLHSCDEKGFVWIDTEQHVVIGGVVHFFFGAETSRSLLLWSGQQQPKDLPKPFLRDFEEWNSRWKDPAGEAKQEVTPSEPPQKSDYAKLRLVRPGGHIIDLMPDLQPLPEQSN